MDAVLNVRQIAQYPQTDSLGPGDLVLAQRGGLGGPYVAASIPTMLRAMSGVGIGLALPKDAQGLASLFLTTANGASQGFNWYRDRAGAQRFLQGGVAGQWTFNNLGTLEFAVAPALGPDQLIGARWWQPALRLSASGMLAVTQQIVVGRNPAREDEVATLGWTRCNTVGSFNGQTGAVCFGGDAIYAALSCELGDHLATQGWVNAQICSSIQQMLLQNPFVFSWCGRVGDVWLTLADIEQQFFKPGNTPRAPTPPLADASNRIATTLFVDQAVEDARQTVIIQFDQNVQQVLDYLNLNYAPLNSPQFTGVPSVPTALPGTDTGQIASTAFVMAAVAESVAGVATWNGRTGNVTLNQQDIIDAQGWDYVVLTGVPTAPTAAIGTSNTQIATTAFVMNQMQAIDTGVLSFNGRSGVVALTLADVTGIGGAPLASPAFSGAPTAATATAGTNTTQLATTAFVTAAVASSVVSFNGRSGAVSLQGNDVSAAGGALVASPAFSGTPTAPTASAGTNTTQLATTAFVTNAIAAAGGVASFNGRTGPVTLTAADITNANPLYLPLAGGTLSGDLNLGNLVKLNAGANWILARTVDVDGSLTANLMPNAGQTGVVYRSTGIAAALAADTPNNRLALTVDQGSAGAAWTGAGAVTAFKPNGDLNVSGQAQIGGNGIVTLAGGPNAFAFSYSAPNVYVNVNGATGWLPITTVSDERLKRDIAPSQVDCLDVLERIPLLRFRWKDRPHRVVPVGLIAQRLRAVEPALVNDPPSAPGEAAGFSPLSIDTNTMLAVLIGAVQQLTARVLALEDGTRRRGARA